MGRISHTATPERKPQRLECCCSHVAVVALARRLAGIVYALLGMAVCSSDNATGILVLLCCSRGM
jgi:hypothetical protein